jgi:hypothetical protein
VGATLVGRREHPFEHPEAGVPDALRLACESGNILRQVVGDGLGKAEAELERHEELLR